MASMNDMIEKALAILENEFHLKHIMIEKNLSGEIPNILLDSGQIQQVLVNLLINAAESIGEHGAITIRSRKETEWVRVEIEDTGCGIAPDHMTKIFEPFFSTKPKGTGLGLAVSFGIIKNHQGNIGATSQMGKGSRFTMDLPLIGKDETPQSNP
jgi:signal transduction histidine kinase